MSPYKVNFRHYGECEISFARYTCNGRLCLMLNDQDEQLVCVATINFPDNELAPDEVCIKDWSENRGIFAVLVDAGILVDTGRRVSTGYVQAKIAKLLIPAGELPATE